MIKAVLDIEQRGNNLGVRLPAAVAREAHLHVDQRVRVLVEGDHVVITPVDDSRLTLKQRLAAYDPKRRTLVVTRPAAPGKRKGWVPDRQDIIWIDTNPQVGREIRDVQGWFWSKAVSAQDACRLLDEGYPPERNHRLPSKQS
ncbi:MAG: AbrB/MazE/SpoVT family DNA-binding domain-containing protein [Candidatus Binatia bacterium]